MVGKFPYKVTRVSHINGCKTKFIKGGRYMSSRPSGAAKKAASQLCARKDIHGQCALNLSIVRTDIPVNERKVYTFNVHRKKLDKPVEVKINGSVIKYEYKMEAEKAEIPESCKDNEYKQSRGRMKSKRS